MPGAHMALRRISQTGAAANGRSQGSSCKNVG